MEYMSTEIRSAREAMTIFKILGIKDITTERQHKNGTTVYELPIKRMWGPSNQYPLRFATYSTGYVRNVSEGNSSPYQINKTKRVTYESGMTGIDRIHIDNWEDRLIYLAKFIIKNYYQKPTYLISDYTMDTIRSQYRQANELRNQSDKRALINVKDSQTQINIFSVDLPLFLDNPLHDIKVIINGHRYNLS